MRKQREKRKQIYILLTAAIMMLTMFTGCTYNNGRKGSILEEGQSDLEYVQSKGTLLVGVTDFAPMDYHDGDDWTGFDANLAEIFAKNLGVEIELVEIDWNKKTQLLEEGSIDCIWNAMTMSDELADKISCTEPYLSNAQVLVLRDSNMEQYDTIEACQHLLFAVESGSAGESLLKELKYRYTTYSTQTEALQSVSSGLTDAAITDIIIAEYYTGTGRELENLQFNISLNEEKLCVGFRTNSDLTEKANEFFKTAYDDGTISSLANQYGIENAVLDF